MKNQTTASKSNNQPVHKIRHGAVSASIWCQETDKGPMFNVTFQRAYKDGDTWKNSTSFGRHNLLVISLIASRATTTWIICIAARRPRASSVPHNFWRCAATWRISKSSGA